MFFVSIQPSLAHHLKASILQSLLYGRIGSDIDIPGSGSALDRPSGATAKERDLACCIQRKISIAL